MSTDSRTWFYSTPTPRPFYIEERVNHTLWKNRMANIHMTCVRAETPILMEGRWANEMPLEFEWQPGHWFILRMGEESKEIVGVMRQILMFKPAFAYRDPGNRFCVEWHIDGGEARWKDLQGKGAYQNLRRLRKAQPVTG